VRPCVRLLFAAVSSPAACRSSCPTCPFQHESAGLVIGIMIIPYVSSVSEDAIRPVPMHLREGSYAMGRNPAADLDCA